VFDKCANYIFIQLQDERENLLAQIVGRKEEIKEVSTFIFLSLHISQVIVLGKKLDSPFVSFSLATVHQIDQELSSIEAERQAQLAKREGAADLQREIERAEQAKVVWNCEPLSVLVFCSNLWCCMKSCDLPNI
jgi:hypothetical protein